MDIGKHTSVDQVSWQLLPGFDKVFNKSLVGREDSDSYILVMNRIDPDGSVLPHSHPEESSYLIVEGKGVATLGEEEFEVLPGSVVHMKPGTRHGIANPGSEDLLYIEVKDFGTPDTGTDRTQS
jgi:quercetin dioxygenase-like cupin family protein